MTARTDITIDFEQAPRLAEIAQGSNEINVQDSHDTLTNAQGTAEGMQYLDLVSTAGGESLGGGTTVGLTTTLLDVQFAFGSTGPRNSGSVTSTNSAGVILIDTLATFQTDNVQRGDWVINFTDESVTEIISVQSQIQVTTRGLRDGTSNTFTSGDSYKIWEVEEGELSGGNFVAVNDLNAAISPVFPTFGRFISKASASSATTANQAQLEFSTFNGGVTLDTTALTTGTVYPYGTPGAPVNNLPDAVSVATARGFTTILVKGNFIFGVADAVDGFTFDGESPAKSLITLTPAALIENCQFQNAQVTGTLDGGCDLSNCHISTLTYVDGKVHNCQFDAGIITLGGTRAEFIRCWSGVAGIDTPIMDMAGTGTELLIRDYQGGLELQNYTEGSDNISIDMASGHIILASTIQSGFFLIRGIGKLSDFSVGAVVNSDDLINKALLTEITNLVTDLREENPTTQEISKKVWDEELIEFDEEESAGYLLNNSAESIEVNTPERIADRVWQRDMSDVFDPATSGGIIKKLKLIYKIVSA